LSGFEDFELSPEIVSGLRRMGYTTPTPVQAETMPIILSGKDLIGLAQTGSGKTAACAIPICERIDTSIPKIQCLVVVPTRELALQYATETQKIGNEKGVSAFAVLGGEDFGLQLSKLNHGVHIAVATPGRLIDFIYSREIDLSYVKIVALDEADEMLSMGFRDDLEFIIDCIVQDHQTLLLSATMPKEIRKLAQKYMKDPEEITLTSEQRSPSSIDHRFVYCNHQDKMVELQKLMKELRPKKAIVFCHSRREVEQVSQSLKRSGVEGADYLHAGLSQDLRRLVTSKFRAGKIRILLGTDVLARGLDFTGVTHVFIYHLAENPDIYVHRSGRTGRYDADGVTVTLVTKRDLRSLERILKIIQQEPKWIGRGPNGEPGQELPRANQQGTDRGERSDPRKSSGRERETGEGRESRERQPREQREHRPREKRATAPEGERSDQPAKTIKMIPPPPNLVQIKKK
jgi:ATP-dependent RNA helicase DeaD